MTAAVDREVLREWRDRHGDVQRDREGRACVRMVWVGDQFGLCGDPTSWFVRGRALCEAHAVERVQQWLDLERGEMTLTDQLEAARRRAGGAA